MNRTLLNRVIILIDEKGIEIKSRFLKQPKQIFWEQIESLKLTKRKAWVAGFLGFKGLEQSYELVMPLKNKQIMSFANYALPKNFVDIIF